MTDRYGAQLALRATGLLRAFNTAGVLAAADVHVAARLGRLGGECDDRVLLAAALAVRGVRLGAVCLDLASAPHTVTSDGNADGEADADGDGGEAADEAALPWPDADAWAAACGASPLVAVGVDGDPRRPLRFVDGLLYLDRYWRQEEQVRSEVESRAARPAPYVDAQRLDAALQRLFPKPAAERQRLAATTAASHWVTVLAGGPGTGKTTTVARLLALLHDTPGPPPRVALAAPTGKAAARLQEAVREEAARLDPADRKQLEGLPAATLHRLLGRRPDSRSRFRHDRHNRLPYDVIVVDETSMVSLTLMARLLEAVRADARLILVGDPDQLASVEAGAVLGDLVASPDADLRRGVVRLTRTWRFGGAIAELAAAVQRGDADAAVGLLRSGAPDLAFDETAALGSRAPEGLDELRADTVAAARAVTDRAMAGDVAGALESLGAHRLLCAHRRGPHGVARWSAEVQGWIAAAIVGYGAESLWYVGRPLLVTANDYEVRLYNGDTGVVVDDGKGGVLAAFGRGGAPLLLPPSRLSAVSTVHAMTVHRAQGSQFERVAVLLPPPESPLLTRELLYTAVTRATRHVRVLGSEEAVRAAVGRPVVRASGLRRGRSPGREPQVRT